MRQAGEEVTEWILGPGHWCPEGAGLRWGEGNKADPAPAHQSPSAAESRTHAESSSKSPRSHQPSVGPGALTVPERLRELDPRWGRLHLKVAPEAEGSGKGGAGVRAPACQAGRFGRDEVRRLLLAIALTYPSSGSCDSVASAWLFPLFFQHNLSLHQPCFSVLG